MKTGIQKDIARHYFWIPTYVGMTKRLKNNTYDTNPCRRERGCVTVGVVTSVIRRSFFEKFRDEGFEEPSLAVGVGTVEWCKTLVENGKGFNFTLAKDIEKQVISGRFKLVPLRVYL